MWRAIQQLQTRADPKEKGESKSSAAASSTPSCPTKSSLPALTKDDSAGKASQEDNKTDPKKWAAATSSNLLRARNLTQSLLTKLQQNEAAEAANRNAEQEHAEREKERLKAKVKGQAKMHEGIINTSFQCMQDLDDALRWTEDSVTKLTHERYAGFAALQVCEKRMKMREKRPVNENFKDSLQEALENEQKILLTARQDIFNV